MFAGLYRKLLELEICCELWIDGSFITKKSDPSDIDLSLMIDESEWDRLSPEARKFLNLLDSPDSKYQDLIDIFICVVYPKDHPLSATTDPDGWACQWSLEHNQQWLKGFVVLKVEASR